MSTINKFQATGYFDRYIDPATGLVPDGLHEDKDGNLYYIVNNYYHNENGPAVIIKKRGSMFKRECRWYHNGKLHREDGPAYMSFTGDNYWFLNGQKHRLCGPAENFRTGRKTYFLFGTYVLCTSLEEFKKYIIRTLIL